ncbi:DUF2842 domain-containing protein [Sphingosinithalassobacter sp. CS137]|uniref:DUF2842 domain-containing protein n=1 Tax=Sphingosinithalassobacter sp. CS137 TaxID=2762748 RepID=UPI00165E7BC7|nr:DUF2842 domain-containing protein [Sphingosinithalassobacter sp. CS137]
MSTEVEPNWRKPVGMLAVLLLIFAWVVIVASFSAEIGALPWPLQMLIYVVLGIAWIFPAAPVLRWMETGRFRR